MATPALPPGFELDAPLPPGFELDAPPTQRTAGRSSEEFARTDPRRVDAREVSFPEKLGRGVVRGGGQLARGLGILVAGPVEAALAGGEHEGKAFSAAEDFGKWADQATAPKGPEKSSFVSDVGEKVGEAAPIIGGALLGGPAVAGVVGTGTAVGNTWADNMRNDVSTGVAAAQTAIAGVTNLIGSMLPGAVGTSVPAKVVSGGVINAATGEAQRQATNAVYNAADRQELAQPFDPAQGAADVITGGATAVAHTRNAQQETEAKAAKEKRLKLDQPSAQGIVDANKAGYVLTPTEAKQGGAVGGAATTVEGLAGEPALAKSVSRKNAETTNKLVRQDVGLADDEPVTRETLAKVRADEGKHYEVLKQIDTIENDKTYASDLDAVTKSYDTAAKDFAHRSENPFQKTIDGLRVKSMSGAGAVEEVKLLRSDADDAYRQGKKGLGRAYRDMANALDNSIDRHLTRMAESGADPKLADAVANYRAARKRIAKTYLADAGLNDTTGNVDAAAYARALKRGAPLDGAGLTIARAATQFPRLFQKPERMGNSGSPTLGDAAIALLSRAGGKGSVALDVATAAARPLTRAALQSEPVQTLLTRRARKEAKRLVPKKTPDEPFNPSTSPGAGGPGPGGGTPPRPGPLGDLTPDWETTPGAGGGKPRGGEEPGLVRAVGEPSPTTGNRKSPLQIPAVPGRPDLPDTMVAGPPAERVLRAEGKTDTGVSSPTAATDRANRAMGEPGAIEARQQQAEAAERARRAAEPRVPAGEVKEGQPPIKAEKTGKIPVGKVTEGQPEIKPLVPKKPIKAGEATELPVERIEPEAPIETGEVVDLTPEQDAAWRKEFGLGNGDAERAKAVAEALKHDAPAVEKAATQLENQPRAFDREIARITEEGKARANESKPAAESSEGKDVAAPEAERDAAAATRPADEQPRADSAAAPDRGGEQAPAGGQAADGGPPTVAELRKKWPGLAKASDEHVLAAEEWRKAQDRVRAEHNYRGTKAGDIHDELTNEWGQKRIADDQVGYLTELAKRLNEEADRVVEDRNTPGTLANRRQAAEDARRAEERTTAMHKANLEEIDLALDEVRDMHAKGRITEADVREMENIGLTSQDSFETASRLRKMLDSKVIARERENLARQEAANAAEAAAEEERNRPPLEIRETDRGFEAFRNGQKVGYLHDNLKRGQAEQLNENASVEMVKVHESERGRREVGPALYAAFNEKHGGRIQPNGKTEPGAWKLWKREYPEKVEEFVQQKAKRIADGADSQMVLGNIKDAEVAQRVSDAVAKIPPKEAPKPLVPKRDVIEPGKDKALGANDAGELLYEREDGSRYRMHNGRPDFGGDLVPKAPEAGEPKIIKTTNDPLEGKVYHVQIPGDDRVFQINRGDNNLGGPTWMIDAGDHWSQGPAPSQNGYVSTHLGDTKAEALTNLAAKVQAFDAQPGYKQGLKRGSAAPTPPAPKPLVPKTTSDIGRTYFDRGPEQLSEAEFGAVEKARTLVRLRAELEDAKKGRLQTGPFSIYKSKAAAVREISALIDSTERAKPERYASDHLAEINKAIRAGKTPSPENIKRYDIRGDDGQQLRPDDLQPAAGEKAAGKTPEPPEEVFSAEKQAPFYSPLSRAIDGLKMERAPAQGWLDTIKGLASKGIKADEIEWSGVKEWLATREGKVTKAELQSFLKEGGVKVEEVQKGEIELPPELAEHFKHEKNLIPRVAQGWINTAERFEKAAQSVQKSGHKEMAAEYFKLAEQANEMAERLETDSGNVRGDPRYSSYQLPGGKNYREVLLTLPPKSVDTTGWTAHELRPKSPITGKPEYQILDKDGNVMQVVRTAANEGEALQVAKQVADRGQTPGTAPTGNYKSPHWEEPNVLAHIRLNDRVDAQGRKVLFVEEVQSDWAQQGKKRGFAAAENPRMAELRRQRDAWLADPAKRGDVWQLNAEIQRLGGTITPGGETGVVSGNIPNAPFVGKTDAWTALAIKRITKMAVDEGYDRVAFINGEQSASRYDLSKHIDRIDYSKNGDGTFDISAIKDGSEVFSKEGMTPDEVADHIGKEAAEKIVKGEGDDPSKYRIWLPDTESYHNKTFTNEAQAIDFARAIKGEVRGGRASRWEAEDSPEPQFRSLHGLDLKVGGEGMKAFYDKIVPNVAKDVVRKLGGEGVDTQGVKTRPGPYNEPTRNVKSDGGKFWLETNKGERKSRDFDSYEKADAERDRQYANEDAGAEDQIGFDITPKMRENAAGGVPLFKGEGGYGAKPLGSPEATEAVLRDKFGSKLIDGLLEQGLLKFALALDEGRTRDIGQGGVKAVFNQRPGEKPHATLYFDRLTAEQAPGMLMHELGEHFGAPRLIGEQRYHMVMGELKKLAETDTEVKEAWQHVKDNYIGEGTPNKIKEGDDTFVREVAAHLVETQPDLPWVRRLVNEIRAFFYEHFGTTMGNRVDANLIRGMAAAALRRAATGGLAGQSPTPRQFRPLVPSSRMPAPTTLQ